MSNVDPINQSVVATVPVKSKPNPLALHGTQGRLIITLQRYALLGWLAFFVLLFLMMALIFISTFAPKPVIAVDANGRVLGTLEYLSGTSRTTQEIEAAAQYAAENCLSLNADTIENDITECMNMMAEPLYNQWLNMLKAGYVSRIKQAAGRSTVQFDKDGVQLLSRKALVSMVHLKGKLETHTLVGTSSESRAQPFDMTLTLTAIPRSSISTRGFRLDELKDN